jgi:probable rRNA maturation factor
LVIFRKRVARLTEAALSRFVGKASRAAGLKGALNVVVTDSRELQLLNSRFLGKDKATDVLSFPPEPRSGGEFAGEIAISAEIAAESARWLGHSMAEEVKILALHGILHLAGYDHEQDKGEMGSKELRLRTMLNLPDGLIERTERREVGNGPRKNRKRSSRRRIRQTR